MRCNSLDCAYTYCQDHYLLEKEKRRKYVSSRSSLNSKVCCLRWICYLYCTHSTSVLVGIVHCKNPSRTICSTMSGAEAGSRMSLRASLYAAEFSFQSDSKVDENNLENFDDIFDSLSLSTPSTFFFLSSSDGSTPPVAPIVP